MSKTLPKNQRLTILCDMDGIIVNLQPYWLQKIAEDHGVVATMEQITRWDLHKCEPLDKVGAEKLYAYLKQPGFFRNAPAIPGALEGFKKLCDAGHNVVIVSSPSGSVSAAEKYEWLAEHLPWFSHRKVMLACEKTLVHGDVIIDDHPDTLTEYGKIWPQALPMGIRYPYNESLLQGPRPIPLFSMEKFWIHAPTLINGYSLSRSFF